MVRILEPYVNHALTYTTLFKGIRGLANTGGKSGHPQIHEVGTGGFWHEIQVNKIEIDGGGTGGEEYILLLYCPARW